MGEDWAAGRGTFRADRLAVSVNQAQHIKALCNALAKDDKRAIEVHLTSQQPHLRNCFCSWKWTGHTTGEQMRMYVQ